MVSLWFYWASSSSENGEPATVVSPPNKPGSLNH